MCVYIGLQMHLYIIYIYVYKIGDTYFFENMAIRFCNLFLRPII